MGPSEVQPKKARRAEQRAIGSGVRRDQHVHLMSSSGAEHATAIKYDRAVLQAADRLLTPASSAVNRAVTGGNLNIQKF